MAARMTTRLAGGCQCGAVRFALTKPERGGSVCHCRMCQKATGQPFFASVTVHVADITWTRGQPAYFRSSTYARRGFCAVCGTPLTWEDAAGTRIAMALGSFDAPDELPPVRQIGVESRVSWWDALPGLPEMTTAQDMPEVLEATNFQHPDHAMMGERE